MDNKTEEPREKKKVKVTENDVDDEKKAEPEKGNCDDCGACIHSADGGVSCICPGGGNSADGCCAGRT